MGLESWWDGFLKDPERNSKIMGLVFILQLIPLAVPLGFPIKYSFYTTDLFNLIEGGPMSYGVVEPGLGPDDVFVYGDCAEHVGDYSAHRDMWSTLVRWVAGEKHIRIICAWFGYSSISVFMDIWDRYMKPYNLEYGVDYVWTEYLPGREAAIKYFAENVGDVLDAINHQPISSYSGFADVNDFNDVTMAMGTVIRTTDHDMYIRQWGTQWPNVKYILRGEFAIGGPYYGAAVRAVTQYDFEIEHIAASQYGSKFLGEEITQIESKEVWAIMYIPLLVWGLYVNWKRQLAEGVSLEPRVGERGQ
jgi:hypothetical protein